MGTRENIPQWNWYNGQFLFSFDEALRVNPGQTISEFYDAFRRTHGLQDFTFTLKNQGAIIALLYALLVVPREIWERDNKETTFAFETKPQFHVRRGDVTDTWNFLRLMRNAISHANFDVNVADSLYTFWNQTRSGDIDFEVTISHEGLGNFLTEIGKYYINHVKAQQIPPSVVER